MAALIGALESSLDFNRALVRGSHVMSVELLHTPEPTFRVAARLEREKERHGREKARSSLLQHMLVYMCIVLQRLGPLLIID